ncbi:MAG: helix-turn-helix domain-containing protein [Nitrospiraceae bacterium]|nr:helix-turn-helix domain-containing protein [Nitrospiraceae bacterium]
MHSDRLPHPDSGSDEKVLILPLGEESKKITQTLSNDSARQVLELLADKPMSTSEIAEELDTPLTTVKYNLDALIESGLITIKQTKWSAKGRKIKIYAPAHKLIVVVPDKTDRKSVIDILRQYLGVLLGAVCVSGIIEVWRYRLSLRCTPSAVMEETAKRGIPTPTPAMKGGGMPSIDLSQILGSHLGVWFFFGCIFVVVLLVLLEYRRKGG